MNDAALSRPSGRSPVVITRHGSVVVAEVVLARLFDPVVVDLLDQSLQVALAVDDDLILDVTQVRFISSAMLGRLVMLWLAAQKRGRQMVLCGVNKTLGNVLRIAGLQERVQVYNDLPTALTALRQKRS